MFDPLNVLVALLDFTVCLTGISVTVGRRYLQRVNRRSEAIIAETDSLEENTIAIAFCVIYYCGHLFRRGIRFD